MPDYPNLVTTLPPELNNSTYLPKITKAVTQWSQIAAWSWTGCLGFAGEPNKAEQEQKLKTLLIDILKKQAQSADAFIRYGNEEAQKIADTLAKDIRNLMLGYNDKVQAIQDLKIGITISDVLEKFTNQPLITTADRPFGEMFVVRVTTNSFSGKIDYALDKEGNPIPNQYLTIIAYPPRPVLSDITITENQLSGWINNITYGGYYLPPSAYIPIGFCS